MKTVQATLIAMIALLAACSSDRTSYAKSEGMRYTGEAGKSLRVRVVWMKHRGEVIHLHLNLKNEGRAAVKLAGKWLALSYDGAEGYLTKGLPEWEIAPGETRKSVFFFGFSKKLEYEKKAQVTVKSSTGGRANRDVVIELSSLEKPVHLRYTEGRG